MKRIIYGFALSIWGGSQYSYGGSYLYATEEERDEAMKEYLDDSDYLVDTFEEELDL